MYLAFELQVPSQWLHMLCCVSIIDMDNLDRFVYVFIFIRLVPAVHFSSFFWENKNDQIIDRQTCN